MQLDVSLMMPADQVELVDAWERDKDPQSEETLTLVAMTRAELVNGGLRCIACHRITKRSEGCTYIFATGFPDVRRAVVCAGCTREHGRDVLRTIATHSYSAFLQATHAAQRGAFLHAPGRA
jgi:hypothetical protein